MRGLREELGVRPELPSIRVEGAGLVTGPVWGMHTQSHGKMGTAPDIKEVNELLELYKSWRMSSTGEERARIWSRMLDIYADQVFSIGLLNATLQPVVRSSKLVNMPETGLYGFDPTSYFGVYMPDAFWFREDA